MLALDGADNEVGVLGEDLMSVHLVEVLCGILAGHLLQDVLTTGVGSGEVGQVIDLGVDNDPERVLIVVLRDLK